MRDNRQTILKLQKAINSKGGRVLVNNRQYFSKKAERARNWYSVTREVWNEDKGRYMPIEVYHGNSLIQIVCFLRDYWYIMNGWDLPDDNEMWNELREKHKYDGGEFSIYNGWNKTNNDGGDATEQTGD